MLVYLLVPIFDRINVNGSGKYWRFNYRFDGKQKTLALGAYPLISLAEARIKRDEAKKLLLAKIDPSAQKKQEEQKIEIETQLKFENIARQWWQAQLPRWVKHHADRVIHSLEKDVFPSIGQQSVKEIKTPDILNVLRQIESRGVNDTALRALQRIKSVFNYAIQTGLIEYNPATSLTGVITKQKEQHQLALPQSKLSDFYQQLEVTPMKEFTRIALKLLMIWFVRSGELRKAKWQDIDWEKKEWQIPADTMKMKRAHVVPLTDWSIELLEQLKPLTEKSVYLFPNYRNFDEPMSENALSYAMARMGYKGKAVPHGFRSLATDVLNENGFDADVIERQLAHIESNKVRAAYHRTEYLPQRREMMQWYSDWLRKYNSNPT